MSDSKHGKKHFMDARRRDGRQGGRQQHDDRVGQGERFDWRQELQRVGDEKKG